MSVAVASDTTNPAIYRYAEGVSPESQKLRGMIARISSDRRRPISFAWRDALCDELRAIIQDCADRGWDGYDADPVSLPIATLTKHVIEVLPEGIMVPTVVPEPDGDISLEWRTNDQKHFILTVTGPSLVYAGIFGGLAKSYGEERFSRALSSTILDILTSYFPKA